MRYLNSHHLQASALLFALVGAGCDPMSHDKYKGELLVSIYGLAVVRDSAYQPPPVDAVLLWTKRVRKDVHVVAERVAVSGKFPAEFRLDLFQPPPPTAIMMEVRGARMSEAQVGVYRQGVLKNGEEIGDSPDGAPPMQDGLKDSFVLETDTSVLYLDQDISADHPISVVTGGINKKGFHLARVVPLSPEESERRKPACLEIFQSQDPGQCAPIPGEDQGLAPVPGTFENNRIRLEIGEPATVIGGVETQP